MRASNWKFAAILLGLATVIAANDQYLLPQAISMRNSQLIHNIQSKILLRGTNSHPAVLIGGGSNVIMGFRADTMSTLLHQPVYNLGLASEGRDYRNVLTMLEASARKGDTVVISSRGFYGNPALAPQPVIVNVNGRSIYVTESEKKFSLPVKSIFRALLPQPKLGPDPYEQLMRLSEKGDRQLCASGIPTEIAKLEPESAHMAEYILDHAKFLNTMHGRGVVVYFSVPDLLVSPNDLDTWRARHESVRQQLAGVGGRWISVPMEQILSTIPGEFCDTALHPNQQRALLRSQSVAAEILRLR